MPDQPNTATLVWKDGPTPCLDLLDQTRLPCQVVRIECRDVELVWEAIRSLRVRGAPAIGIAAAYGLCLGLVNVRQASRDEFLERLDAVADYLASSRPTAVNLFWALQRMRQRAAASDEQSASRVWERLVDEAKAIHEEDRAMCRAIGRYGAELLESGMGVLTHCNAGGLATSEYGTALAAIFTAHDQGKKIHVFVDETRPLLQGARLTSWELVQHGVPATLICDSMAAQVMREGRVQAVITGADRIARNGDAANKIGTYGLAVLAEAHEIPFYIAAPRSTFDLAIGSGGEIPIEERDAREITHGMGKQTAPVGVGVYNPAFDVTPARLIRAIITDVGIIQPVDEEHIAERLMPARRR